MLDKAAGPFVLDAAADGEVLEVGVVAAAGGMVLDAAACDGVAEVIELSIAFSCR